MPAKTSDKFKELYQQLNAEQKLAVDTIEGPVMVIAGPGTGKTQILTLRVANILLKTQINPGNILALTFSESGAATMRRRLAEIIGPAAYQVRIATFHGFCNELIQTCPDDFPRVIARQPSNEIRQIKLLQSIIDSIHLEFLKPFSEPYFYLTDVRRSISQLKKEGIGPEEYERQIKKQTQEFTDSEDLYYDSGRYQGKMKGKYSDLKRQLDKNQELAKIYLAYQDALAEAKLYDYDDMILEVAQALAQNSDRLLRLQERFQYFLVDEHQDTNNAQNKVLELLSSFYDQPNLFVVGDEKQAIFRFQGASLENFLYFKKLYPAAKLITLQKNYRSTQAILDLAHDLIQNNSRRLVDALAEINDQLVGEAKHPEKLAEVYEFKRPESEYFFLAEKASELIKAGVSAKEIAIIYRDNQDAVGVTEILEKYGLPFRVESGNNALRDPAIRQFLEILRFVADPGSEERLLNILHAPWLKLPPLDIYKLLSPGVRRKISLLELLAAPKRLKSLGIDAAVAIEQFATKLLRWQRLATNFSLAELFETITRESGFLSYILEQPNSALGLARLNALFREIKKINVAHKESTLKDFVSYLNTLEEYRVPVREGGLGFIPEAVRLMTAHSAKGLEFDYVFIINVQDGHWGNRRIPQLIKPIIAAGYTSEPKPGEPVPSVPPLRGSPSAIGFKGEPAANLLKLDDERRLFYVALTRARQQAFITHASQSWDGREQSPSQFITEIRPELRANGPADKYEAAFEKKKEVLYQPRQPVGFSIFEKDYLRALFFKRGVSAVGLNNFLNCPWRYFYLNLLRIPQAKSRHQIYGTAIHAALKDFFDQIRNSSAGLDFLLTRFRDALASAPLSPADQIMVLTKGETALKKYYSHYQNTWPTNTQNEFRVNSLYLPMPGLEQPLKLTGVLDKIEFLSDKKSINVVDYKTGKAKTRNELEGKTKNATGDYQRQLTFYRLLLDNYPTFPQTMVSGEVDFIEPDSKGEFHKEKFIISPEQTEAVKEQIFDLADQVLNLKFWNNRCDDRECEFCKLRDAIANV